MDQIYLKLKPYITAKNIFLLLVVLFLGIIFWNFGKAWSFPDTSWPLAKGEKEKIRTEVVQKFTASRNGLARIEILFGNSDVSPGGRFTFKLLEEDCQKSVRETDLDITSLNSDNTTDFIFSKINDSKDKTYCLAISYAQKKGGKKAEIFIADNTLPEKKYFSVNGEEMAGKSLPMRPAYKNANLFQDIEELNQRISQYKPWFLKHYYLYVIVFGFLILSIALVAILIII